MKHYRIAPSFAFFTAGALVLACSGRENDREFGDGTNPKESTNGGDVVEFDTTQGGGATSPTSKCAGTSVSAKALPVYLVFMFDKSGSMGRQDYNARWAPCSSALRSFLEDSRSKGIRATLDFFPLNNDLNQSCAASYATTSSALRTLPEAAGSPPGSLTAKLTPIVPDGSTPTLPAILGAVATAKDVRDKVASKDGGKVAIVLITDGEPMGCDGNTIDAVANAARAVRSDIQTFVIGVSNVNGLDEVAKAGDPEGKRRAIIVEPNPRAGQPTTSDQFLGALDVVRGSTLACDYGMPASPEGKQLELGKVNVVYTPGGKSAVTLPYNKNCDGEGWRYDDPAAPKKIVLCATSCDAVKRDKGAKLDIELGCRTSGTDGSIPK